MIPVIALVGRPNVGKSTLFNCFTKSRDALVADWPGLTRDRQYGEGRWDEHRFLVVDTGGLTGDEAGLFSEMARQAELAIAESDVIAFMVDARAGVTGIDQQLAKQLRATGKPIQLVVNKTDGLPEETVLSDFFELGLGQPVAIAASHQRGVTQLLQLLLEMCPEAESLLPEDEPEDRMRLAVIGRPNVGKSTLVNRLLGEDRMVVFDQPGTTMDSIAIPLTRHGETYTLIDTAGVRRRKNMHEVVEKFSVIKTLQAIQTSNVAIMLLNAQEGVVEQDLHILQHVLKAGRAVVIGVNKWDHLSVDQKADMKRDLSRRMAFMHWADLHFISARHGTHVGALFRSAQKA
jgi:GTP-binding protein